MNYTEIPKNYSNAKIYTIRSPNTEMYYIGSTTQPLSKRLQQHKTEFKNKSKSQRVISSFVIHEFGDAYIELLEIFPCKFREELEKREGELIREHKEFCTNKNKVVIRKLSNRQQLVKELWEIRLAEIEVEKLENK